MALEAGQLALRIGLELRLEAARAVVQDDLHEAEYMTGNAPCVRLRRASAGRPSVASALTACIREAAGKAT
jgi:hypothetical protein